MGHVIPSLWGTPVFEFVDLSNPSKFIVDYENYQSVTRPDFTRARVENYVKLPQFCSQLHFFDRAFLPPNDDKDSMFKQYPQEFSPTQSDNFISSC